MANINLQQQMPLIMATAAIVCIAGTLKTSAAAAQLHGPASGGGGSNFNTALYDNRWLPLSEEQSTSVLHKPLALHRYGIGGGGQEAEERRSYRSNSSGGGGGVGGGFEAMLNGLSNLSGLGHISNGYASVAPTHTEALALASSSSKQEIPIYEEQHDDAAVAAVAATANDYGDGGNGDGSIDAGDHIQQHHQQQQHQQQHSSAGLHPTIYDYPAVATGGGGGGAHGVGYLPAFGGAEHNALTPSEAQQYKEAVVAAAQQHQQQHQQQVEQSQGHHYAYDKISVGNYLNHYDQSSDGFESYRQHHADEQQYQQQQQHQQQHQLEHASYSSSAGGSASGGSDYEDHVDSDGGAGDHGANFLAESSGHDGAQAHSHQSHHHVDIINYVPVKHVKKEHVPVEKPVKIPVSHAVIIPVKKPVPIHIPITKQVQVPIEKELKVPVERIIPVPVEKHIPVPVAKHVPYHVVKYVPIKVPKPFPVKVPVFKTVLHKVKSWW